MTKPGSRAHRITQTLIVFPTKGALDQKERMEVVSLIARLLLQVASARNQSEVTDDPS